VEATDEISFGEFCFENPRILLTDKTETNYGDVRNQIRIRLRFLNLHPVTNPDLVTNPGLFTNPVAISEFTPRIDKIRVTLTRLSAELSKRAKYSCLHFTRRVPLFDATYLFVARLSKCVTYTRRIV
jgi:hypothetical protein